jgi:uncharacterized membrane protein
MDLFAPLGPNAFGLTPIDLIALGWFFLCTVAYNFITARGRLGDLSLLGAIQVQRQRWFYNMAQRHDRVVDVLLVGNLAAGNSFFASTSIVLLGALSALLGSGEKAQGIIDRIPLAMPSSPVLWDLKIVLMMTIFVYAFFKFAWAFRLAHYAMIMVGATPFRPASLSPAEEQAHKTECLGHSMRTARVAGLAAEHGNLGLRSYYFAMAAIGWFFSPLWFIATTSLVLLIVTRREYFSRSLAAIADHKTTTISTLGS